ncbi:MAG: HEPN domain-containing protein [Magnetococcus sp. DMHC-1]
MQPEQIILFGSMARGEATADSDIDLLVVEKEGFSKERSRWRELVRIRELLAGFPMSKDILLYSHDEVMHWKDALNHVVAEAVREGVLLYESPAINSNRLLLEHANHLESTYRRLGFHQFQPAINYFEVAHAMNTGDQSEMLRRMADKDYRALLRMQDPMQFDVEIFGFHVQQAVEKGVKAWLSILNVQFPKKHDLGELASLLKQNGATVPDEYMPLMEYTNFASMFRYDSCPELEDEMDRNQVVVLVGRFLEHVDRILANVPRK